MKIKVGGWYHVVGKYNETIGVKGTKVRRRRKVWQKDWCKKNEKIGGRYNVGGKYNGNMDVTGA